MDEKKALCQYKSALQLHIASLFDVNECGLDFIPVADRSDYEKVLIKALLRELPSILDPYQHEIRYEAVFETVLKRLRKNLDEHGRREPNEALRFWRKIANARSGELAAEKIQLVPFLMDAARAYLSIQASSASAERLFSDAGLQEGARRQHTDPSMSEMLLTMRHLVMMRTRPEILRNLPQTGSLGVSATVIYNLAVEIATKIASGQ